MTVAISAGQWVPIEPPSDPIGCVAAWDDRGDLVVVAPMQRDRVIYSGPYRILGVTRRAMTVTLNDGSTARLFTECEPCGDKVPP